MIINEENYYSTIPIVFINSSETENLNYKDRIMSVLETLTAGDRETLLLNKLSSLIIGEGVGDIDSGGVALTIGVESNGDNLYDGDYLIPYEFLRGPYKVNIIVFEDSWECVVLEEKKAIYEIILAAKALYKRDVSENESLNFISIYSCLAKKYNLGEIQ